ncbi:matrixin family metalloprotease [Lentilactobacillus kosonis]|nr:matrixin family metalloprotease [Lentilactobacillus kosonis]
MGHALGLSHNGKDKNSIMYPTTSWNCKAKVDKNDINLLRQLYLKPCN